MGTTPRGLPYPDPNEPIAGGADAIKALALAVESRTHIQAGTAAVVIAAATSATVAVTYPRPFARGPRVTATVVGTSGYFAYLAGTPTTTSAIVGARQYKDAVVTANVTVAWIAVDAL